MRSLRARLVLSHVLPLLVVVPLMGIALIYVVEGHVLLPSLAQALSRQAIFLVDLAREEPAIWSDAARAAQFVARMGGGRPDERLMLLDRTGRLLASSDPADRDRLGRLLAPPGLARAAAGQLSVVTLRSRRLTAEVVDVVAPVSGADGRTAGFVRLSLRLAGVADMILGLRYVIAGVLLAGIVLGGAVGWTLAAILARPLREVTSALSGLADGREWTGLEANGPEEIALLARSFNALVVRLRGLEEARRQLLANLVHELGRPLGAMLSAVQALRSGADADASLRGELLEGTEDELKRLRRLVDDLARHRDRVLGTLELKREAVHTAEWLARLALSWREAARRKELRWTVAVPADLPAIEVDPDRLAQAVGNLLSNAIAYTPTGGAVEISAGADDDTVWIRVSDSGPGIPPEDQARIFEPFYRGQSSRRFPQGMGLGLAIAHDVAAAHGGRLEVESTPPRGSRFTLRLPRGPARPPAPSGGPSPS
ncbi:MAG: ATP-binding protein [Armatimonadota bacterium]|nr:ATP-binding protein [Armatimonadota bacterium]